MSTSSMVWMCFWFAFLRRRRRKYDENTLARSIYASIPSGCRCTYQFIIMIRVSIYIWNLSALHCLHIYMDAIKGTHTHTHANNPCTAHIWWSHISFLPFNFQEHFCVGTSINFACQINIVHGQGKEYIHGFWRSCSELNFPGVTLEHACILITSDRSHKISSLHVCSTYSTTSMRGQENEPPFSYHACLPTRRNYICVAIIRSTTPLPTTG